jgi:hypothetical protein
VTLLNFTLEVLASDWSKKIAGFFPDVHLTDRQKKSSQIKAFLRDLYFYVTQCFVEGLNELYDAGGIEWMDSDGVVWHMVPVMSFVATDMEEAWRIKALYKGTNCNRPCHLCTIRYKDCDKVPEELHYRKAGKMIRLIKRFRRETV